MTTMPRNRTAALVCLLALAALPLHAGVAEIREHVEYLASDALEGRLTGSAGARAAGDFLIAQLQSLGASPLPGREGFALPFEFTAGTKDIGSKLTLRAGEAEQTFSGEDSVVALAFSDNGAVSGPVVFAGYGLSLPADQELTYDSYATLDVTDKIVVVLRYFPENTDQDTRAELARYSGLRYKAMQARERGAKALLVVTGPNSPNAGETVPMTFDTAVAGSGIVAASVSGPVADALFGQLEGKDLAAAQTALDDANPHITGFEIPGIELTLEVAVEREKRTGRNIVGLLPATEPLDEDKPYVLIGAHFDHLGRGRSANSLAGKDEADKVHHGADDNASGTAAVLEAASQLAGMKRRRNVVVAFWSGEELGVLGSTDFIKQQVLDPAQIAACINFDMVGRMRDNKLTLQAVGSSSVWPQLIEQTNVPMGFDVQLGQDPYLPTDSSSFNQADVPTLNFFTGSHEDYHRPSDTADKIDYEDLARVARFGALVAMRVANTDAAPDFVKVAPTREEGGDRDTVRAFTGTIPDYGTEVQGLLLSGVIEGGPADEAGLTGGDVIVEFGGREITNIYDYTYALDAVKIGEPVKVVFLREGERMETTITPRARD